MHILDLLGSALIEYADVKSYDSLSGVRSQPIPKDVMPTGYFYPHWDEIIGNIFLDSTFKRLDENSRRRGINYFDLITIRPVGPLWDANLSFIEGKPEETRKMAYAAFLKLLTRGWSRLSPDQGVLVCQLTNEIKVDPIFLAWITRLNDKGISAQIFDERLVGIFSAKSSPILKIVKTEKSQTLLQ